MLVLATGSFCMPMPVDDHFGHGHTVQAQPSQPILNVYPPVHACDQPHHEIRDGSAATHQAQLALSGIAKQQPLQRTPLCRAEPVPQPAGQLLDPPSPLSGSNSAFNAAGPQLTRSPSLRSSEEQTCAAQVRRRLLGEAAREVPTHGLGALPQRLRSQTCADPNP
jgi:hypothetical protein